MWVMVQEISRTRIYVYLEGWTGGDRLEKGAGYPLYAPMCTIMKHPWRAMFVRATPEQEDLALERLIPDSVTMTEGSDKMWRSE